MPSDPLDAPTFGDHAAAWKALKPVRFTGPIADQLTLVCKRALELKRSSSGKARDVAAVLAGKIQLWQRFNWAQSPAIVLPAICEVEATTAAVRPVALHDAMAFVAAGMESSLFHFSDNVT